MAGSFAGARLATFVRAEVQLALLATVMFAAALSIDHILPGLLDEAAAEGPMLVVVEDTSERRRLENVP